MGRNAVRVLVAALGVIAVAGAFLALRPHETENASAVTGAQPAPAEQPRATAAAVKAPAATARKQLPNPVRVVIPAIGVDARVIRLGLNPDKTIEVPTNFADTGWFEPGPEPGEQGAAVIVGHLEGLTGPGVFIRLSQLKQGSVITVHLEGGRKVRFVARSTMRVPKNRFPTNLVYAQTPRPTLRLVTCAGPMSPATGYHPDNYIVFATLAPAR